ncbi:hypothetical protein D1871_01655 [Nakamurella silvestris]|nr:hypothetical protein D1871_01655 [Nakamurella silvestris]
MTPSLLPREWYLQGVASGICVGLGYAFGATLGWLLRSFGFRPWQEPRRRLAYRVLLLAAVVLIPLFGVLGARWQSQVRELVHVDTSDRYYYALVLLIAFVLARLLIGVARLLRRTVRRLGRFGARWIPAPLAKLIATIAVTAVLITLVNNTLGPALLKAANQSFSISDQGTPDDAVQPTAIQRSGSAASLVRWSDLGREGRGFVAGGPTTGEIAAFTGNAAQEPIRVYAGLESADSLQAEADLVVRELERTGAFDRSVLVVATTTGRGWVNQAAAAALEYLWGGDTAIAAMQYSHFPSPVAFVVDTATPPEAGRVLFDAVRARWLTEPVDSRPRLLVLGESLGAYGGQGAFGSLDDLAGRADGAVWVGTPRFTPLWSQITGERDAGSPEQVPELNHCAVVCFAGTPADLPAGAHPKVVYLQHATDPVVWWSGDLLFREPDWLAEGNRAGFSSHMTWFPLATFWQVTMDMVFSSDMPDGYGHHYGLELADAWAAVVPPTGWTAADTTRLRAELASIVP